MSHESLKRVVHLVPSLDYGGMEKLVVRLVQQRPTNVTQVVCLGEAGPLSEELTSANYNVTCLQATPLSWSVCWTLRRLLARLQPEILHCHNLQAFTFGSAAALPALGIRVVLTKHGTRMHPDRTLGERFRVSVARRCRLVAVSPEIRTLLGSWSGRPEQEVHLIRNGVPYEQKSPLEIQRVRASYRKLLGMSASDFVVACVARLSEEKDLATLLKAFSVVQLHHSEAKLLLIGDGPCRDSLTALIQELGLTTSVRLLGQRDDVDQLLHAADAGVLTSRTEGLPLTLMEAMSAAKPVVSTAVGGVPELVQDGVQGLLASAGNIRAISDALLLLAEQPDLATSMGRRGRQTIAESYSMQVVAQAYESLYQSPKRRAA